MGGMQLIVQISSTGVVVHVNSYCMPMPCPRACCFARPLYIPLHRFDDPLMYVF
jgi:hypothetical protein